MNDNRPTAIGDQALLAAMRAVDPPKEKLMADRFALREKLRETQAELEHKTRATVELDAQLSRQMRKVQEHFDLQEVLIPRYIGVGKFIVFGIMSLTVIALGLALFNGFFKVESIAILLGSLFLPILLIDLVERKFGRWLVRLNDKPYFVLPKGR